jgi:hypothetical protein
MVPDAGGEVYYLRRTGATPQRSNIVKAVSLTKTSPDPTWMPLYEVPAAPGEAPGASGGGSGVEVLKQSVGDDDRDPRRVLCQPALARLRRGRAFPAERR